MTKIVVFTHEGNYDKRGYPIINMFDSSYKTLGSTYDNRQKASPIPLVVLGIIECEFPSELITEIADQFSDEVFPLATHKSRVLIGTPRFLEFISDETVSGDEALGMSATDYAIKHFRSLPKSQDKTYNDNNSGSSILCLNRIYKDSKRAHRRNWLNRLFRKLRSKLNLKTNKELK